MYSLSRRCPFVLSFRSRDPHRPSSPDLRSLGNAFSKCISYVLPHAHEPGGTAHASMSALFNRNPRNYQPYLHLISQDTGPHPNQRPSPFHLRSPWRYARTSTTSVYELEARAHSPSGPVPIDPRGVQARKPPPRTTVHHANSANLIADISRHRPVLILDGTALVRLPRMSLLTRWYAPCAPAGPRSSAHARDPPGPRA